LPHERACLAPHPSEGVDKFGNFLPLFVLVAGHDRMVNAMRDMVFEDFVLDTRQGCANGPYLGNDVDTIAVILDHARDATHLAFDAV
jgi:hypothetical protein